jgi:hypothetical protein
MRQIQFTIAATALLLAIAAHADDEERDGFYKSMLSCAAFHTIEASKSTGTAVDAQQALAVEFAEAAVPFAADGKLETANVDLKAILDDFQNKLDTGNPREMAEQWTNTEFACSDLYAAKDGLVRARKKELADAKTAD